MDFVDTHFHNWALDKFPYPWPTADMSIYKDYYPCGLENAVADTPVQHAIFVQCLNCSAEEAEWVMDMATRHPIIKGVVAGLDLTSTALAETINRLKPTGFLKGARHILDMEADDWITRDDVSRGLEILANHNLTFDLLVRPRHLQFIPQVVSKHPRLRFIIDHIAKPNFHDGKMGGWKDEMTEIAQFPNVFCKISGLISEQRTDTWRTIDYKPFIEHVLSVFGSERCVFGSDWPVFELVGATYRESLDHIRALLAHLPAGDQAKIFRDNAVMFYNLNI
ncbi:uncharacterized protein y4mH-like isoform X1 [Dreissena polymorpha]|uniref:Amidohydrolase-related domain-containing protein n=1 Tax=Dreissena polymorpha TaxID=45954 RepID=A0A9D4QTP7_DREPO|nr:uncharacterized protein y4mH-like isoform X1 [Dreissena polymorpha]KAH3842312.1 hypothetical protein DPMN_115809 [Dreissena polymorpha]